MMPKNTLAVFLSLLAAGSSALALPAVEAAPLEKRFDLTCSGNSVPVDAAQRCVDYLSWLGDTDCVVDSDSTQFCDVGNPSVKLMGSRYNGASRPSSRCRDVAAAAQQIINSCNQNGMVSGTTAAVGNGDLLVSFSY